MAYVFVSELLPRYKFYPKVYRYGRSLGKQMWLRKAYVFQENRPSNDAIFDST